MATTNKQIRPTNMNKNEHKLVIYRLHIAQYCQAASW